MSTYFDKSIIKKIKLPSLPKSLQQCMSAAQENNKDIKTLASLIEKDPAISSTVLKLANSSLYTGFKPTADILTGLTRLGMASLVQIIITQYFLENFLTEEISFISIKSIIKQHIATSQMAFEIGLHLGIENINNLFIAGLFHDLGLILKLFFFKKELQQIADFALQQGYSLHEAEQKLGLTPHGEVSSLILQEWNMPQDIVTLVQHHHTTSLDEVQKYDQQWQRMFLILKIADKISHKLYEFKPATYRRDVRINKIELDTLSLPQDVLIETSKKIKAMVDILVY
jgi:HD-like signal output (HDOD) protein